MNKHDRMKEQIAQHGRDLLAAFPRATETDPGKLCRKLHRLEAQAAAITLAVCNGDQTQEAGDAQMATLVMKVHALLGMRAATDGPRVWVNWDPRGYALKVRDEDVKTLRAAGVNLYTDMGGYGILSPEFDNN